MKIRTNMMVGIWMYLRTMVFNGWWWWWWWWWWCYPIGDSHQRQALPPLPPDRLLRLNDEKPSFCGNQIKSSYFDWSSWLWGGGVDYTKKKQPAGFQSDKSTPQPPLPPAACAMIITIMLVTMMICDQMILNKKRAPFTNRCLICSHLLQGSHACYSILPPLSTITIITIIIIIIHRHHLYPSVTAVLNGGGGGRI